MPLRRQRGNGTKRLGSALFYTQTQTTSDDWRPLTEGSTDGKVLGDGTGTTTYYYLKNSLNFTNNRTDNDGNLEQ